jgi:catechol 2,3-dioxygenase-like lactoylglutathione lyase family enzyme
VTTQMNKLLSATVSIPVSSLQRASAWYRDKLGFACDRVDEAIGWMEMTHPDLPFNIGLAEVQDVHTGGLVLMLNVGDLVAAQEHLAKSAVHTSGISVVEGLARVLTLEDRDGHKIMLREAL